MCQGDPSTWGAPPVGKTYLGVNESGQLTTVQNDGTITVIGAGLTPGAGTVTNSSGNTIVTPPTQIYTQTVDVTGVASTRIIVISQDDASAGDICDLRLNWPDVGNIDIQVRSGATDGPLIAQKITVQGEGTTSGFWHFVFESGSWVNKFGLVPAA